ncbi:CHC2 zinc finger domain-containing protein [Secundilactobacillus odoratitofui]|uniref:CHC2 zinc finger domain-containing protein n=1 Tax=Secundilactobacillus odoratitofui TaxID=480930 RepID=UPI003F722F33
MFFGLCPFHEERTPSFSVTEDKQIFHCFSCGRGGNVFKFVMELENLSFQEAVMKVADFSHVTIDDSIVKQVGQTGPAGDPKSPNNQLIKLHQDATKLYSHILLNTEIGQPALDYLHQRGLTDQTIKDYGLGYAPNQEILKPFF